jgi:hypothetical protein
MHCGLYHGRDRDDAAKMLPGSQGQTADYQTPSCYLARCRISDRMLTSCKV